MEFYSIRRREIVNSIKAASSTSKITGKSFIYHWIDCIYCIIRFGCGPSQYLEGGFYKLRSFDRDKTYTKKRIDKIRKIFNNKEYERILSNKVEFNTLFSRYLKRRWIYCKNATVEDIKCFYDNVDDIIVKPNSMSKGRGIYLLDKSMLDITSFVGKDVLLEECLVNHPQMRFNNRSLNTLRITTIMDSHDNVNIIKISLRCGVGDSVVDNFCAGGVVYPVNKDYGRIEGPGCHSTLGQECFVHPGSDIFMLGREIPFWTDIIAIVKEAAGLLPQVRFIGWDVAITDRGPAIIEGNQRPGAQLIEYQGTEKGLYRKMLSYR